MKLLMFLAVVVTDILLCQVVAEGYEESACLDCQQLLLKQNKAINQLSVKIQRLESTQARPSSGDGWTLAFRGTAYIGKSVYAAFKDGTGIPSEVESGCKQVTKSLPCNNHYRNTDVFDKWDKVKEVSFILYSNYQKVKEILFDGTDTTYMNWFDKSRVKFSTWKQIKTNPTNYFSIAGDIRPELIRAFFINQNYDGCPLDRGWFVAVDRADGPCSWEKASRFPVFKYARQSSPENWTTGDVANADMFAIFVKFYDTP